LRQTTKEFPVATRGKGFYDITAQVTAWVAGTGFTTGLLTLFIRHTSASLLIQENADPDVLADLETFFDRIAPEGRGLYLHSSEGPDDMPAHIRAAMMQTGLSIPLLGGRLALGTWQGIYVVEHRRHPHRRTVAGHLLAD
jgi:secondary thiamine-phosphate synthase enzyme